MNPIRSEYPLFIAGRAETTGQLLDVRDKFTGAVVTRVHQARPEDIEKAIAASAAAFHEFGRWPAWKRRDAILACADEFKRRSEELAMVLCIEAGKPLRDARGEVGRLIETFQIAAEESLRSEGVIIPLDRSARTQNHTCYLKRVPVGPVSLIAPFNFPLNLVAHKVAPALAAGCTFVLKPASVTPIGALLIGEALSRAGLPEGTFSVLPCSSAVAGPLSDDPRLKVLSFTGSPEVGWKLRARAVHMKVVLELGGNAACIVDEGTDLDDAIPRIVTGAFYQSGQVCISVQRLFVHEKIYAEFRERFVKAVKCLSSGDPKLEQTVIGPMISEQEADRIMDWIGKAQQAGASCLCGNKRQGAVVEATVMENVPRQCELYCKEAFGPVVTLSSFADFSQVLIEANDSKYGLQCGVFTRDIERAQRAWDELEVGNVVINDVPTFRSDVMPYGGVKESGTGREGVRFAIEDFTEPRGLIVRRLGK